MMAKEIKIYQDKGNIIIQTLYKSFNTKNKYETREKALNALYLRLIELTEGVIPNNLLVCTKGGDK